MEERFIDAVVIKSGEKVRVRQTEAGSEYFVTEDNSPYHSKELDFTQQDIVDKLTQDLQDQMGYYSCSLFFLDFYYSCNNA